MNFFYDLNMWGENICLPNVRNYFEKVADWHGVSLARGVSNREIKDKYDKEFPQSEYQPHHWDIKGSFQPDDTRIQNVGFC